MIFNCLRIMTTIDYYQWIHSNILSYLSILHFATLILRHIFQYWWKINDERGWRMSIFKLSVILRSLQNFFAIFCHWGNWYANMRKKKCVVTLSRLKVFCIFAFSVRLGKMDDVRKFVYKDKFIFVYFTLESFKFLSISCFPVLWKLAFIAG